VFAEDGDIACGQAYQSLTVYDARTLRASSFNGKP
jgi:hypothetical protein